MPIQFTKMHGLGNDFVVIDGIRQTIPLLNIPQLCDRHIGIGCDQLLLIEPTDKADFACRIYNADGSEAEQCGNGMRCVARFINENKFTSKQTFSIALKNSIVTVTILENNLISVAMGIPNFLPANIPFITDQAEPPYLIENLLFTVLSIGNPHAITFVSSIDTAPVNTLGKTLSNNRALFPQGVNVGFAEIINQHQIRLRTFERGVGETFSCGSNACAAVIAGIMNHQLDKKVTVNLAKGDLIVDWSDQATAITMTGPATIVFHGEL